ncbi:hypothetical protein [Sphingobacterium faecale]|uniref:CHAT domain-containing protein n=1 Tax=Sphingobacterium faecale TaxID=2803775 RepID=A0ABS1RAY2_9SPHI|nr:hypothetical protein [Sphingobacterium faecale]MBL1411505.1 hypothetical protein [Sphingobacterium faecale]
MKEKDGSGMQILNFHISHFIGNSMLDNIIQLLNHYNRISVFLFSAECHSEVKEAIENIRTKSTFAYYYSVYSSDYLAEIKGDSRYFSNVNEFYKIMYRDSKKIFKYISKHHRGLKKSSINLPNMPYINEEFLNFKPIVSNVLNIYKADNTPFISHHHSWEKAPLEIRWQIIIESLESLDEIHKSWGEEKKLSDRFFLPTLILVFPYHHPIIKKALEKRGKNNYTKMFNAEQNDDYLFGIKELDDSEISLEKLKDEANQITSTQIEVLDGITFLHSTFQFSPSIRFPIKSSELNSSISLVSLGKKNGILTGKHPYKAILKIGKKLNSVYLKDEIEKYLNNRNGQILVISDLPIEWILINNIPLGFITDVCRIQDSNIQGIINNYSAFSKIRFQLSSISVKRTLVIFSDDDQDKIDFMTSYNLAKSYQHKLGFGIEIVSSIIEIKKLIQQFDPEILIFDCHCNFDKDSLTCYLKIGNEKIYPKDIVANSIAAPIIYLASCNTNPNYDNLDKLNDAFFVSGALSVTGTFLPINMTKGTLTYLRMLNLLNSKNERSASGNWLHLVCFTIRTSLIWDARIKSLEELDRDLTSEEHEKFIEFLTQLHNFEERKTVFKSLVEKGVKLSENLKLTLSDTNLEFMYYNHYGRPDLIMFKD